MKKQYIQPQTSVVVIRLIGSVLGDPELQSLSRGAFRLDSRQAYDDRFEDYDDEEWDWE